jgi:hypothetical protein
MQSVRRSSNEQNPFLYYLSALLYVFLAALLYAVALAPLGALFLFAEGSALKFLALLSPLLFILIVLPLRFSFAQALCDRWHARPFSLKTAFSFSLYGEKVAEGLLHLLHVLKWAIPLAVFGGVMYILLFDAEAFTQPVVDITSLGQSVTVVWKGIGNFLTGIFGGAPDTVSGGFGEGLVVLMVIAAVCVLVLLYGVVRNSAYRYIWSEATVLDKNPRLEARRSLRGRRFQQLGVALLNLILWSPVVIVLYNTFAPKEALTDFTLRAMDLLTGETTLTVSAIPYGKLAVVFFACWLPLVPIRRIITASFATARLRRQAGAAQTGMENQQEPTLPLYQDMPSQGGRETR